MQHIGTYSTSRLKVFNCTDITKIPAIQIQYIGPKLYAKVAVAAGGDITFTADDTNGETTVDPDIGYAAGAPTLLGIVDLSTPHASINTYGELKRHIDGQQYWRCNLIGVKPTDLTNDTLAEVAATSCKTMNGLTLYLDNDVVINAGNEKSFGFSITNEKFLSNPAGGHYEDRQVARTFDTNCINKLHYLDINLTSAGTGLSYSVFACNDETDEVISLYGPNTLVTATAEQLGTAPSPDYVQVQAPRGWRMLVQAVVTTTKYTVPVVYCVCSTEDETGGLVPDNNYTGMV